MPSHPEVSDVLIAGGGIIGLALALELRRQGLSVTVLEQGQAMRESSWAAAGMLAAEDPENPPALAPLARYSLGLYPHYLAEIERLSGLRIPLQTSGALQGARRAPAQPVDPRAHVPDLVAGPWRFSLLEEHSLDPRDLCVALPAAARASGVSLLEDTAVHSLHRRGGLVQVETAAGATLAARHFVACTGAWAGVSLGPAASQVSPRKGQALMVTLPAWAPPLPHVVRIPGLYLVPRTDKRVLVGATVEDAGFDRSVNWHVIEALYAAGCELWPPLAAGRITDSWAGLRPATPDGLPILGPLDPETPDTWIATGHFRNGILLAPATAQLMAQLIVSGSCTLDLAAFAPSRFSAATAGHRG